MSETTRTGGRTKVDLATFLDAWHNSNSVEEVADKTGLAVTTVRQRATQYRKDDVPLNYMPRKKRTKQFDKTVAQQILADQRGVTIEEIQQEAAARKEQSKSRNRQTS